MDLNVYLVLTVLIIASVSSMLAELPVRFPRVGGQTRGTFAGVIEKIPYLRGLGISAVELLPVFRFENTIGTL